MPVDVNEPLQNANDNMSIDADVLISTIERVENKEKLRKADDVLIKNSKGKLKRLDQCKDNTKYNTDVVRSYSEGMSTMQYFSYLNNRINKLR